MSEAVRVDALSGGSQDAILGGSAAIRRAVELAQRFAPTPLPILLVGPTGSGKELFARSIHAWSGRDGELVDVNCGAMPRELTEALLFGHRRGAFTGAVESAHGMVEAAHGGTLFLDELCSLAGEAQVKLLRFLESGEARRLGETAKRRSDVRVIAAAQDGLAARIEDGQFRRDLFHRLAGVVIDLPALAERREDIELLAHAFAKTRGVALSGGALRLLAAQPWPGNVRELRLVIERAALLVPRAHLEADDVREALSLAGPLSRPSRRSGDVGRTELLDTGRHCGGDAGSMASLLGVSRATLFRKLRAEGLTLKHLRAAPEAKPDPV